MADLTVLMTVYNGLPYLHAAIRSILDQTFDNFEFLIVNDCSTDDSRKAILGYSDPRIRLIDNRENLNQTRSLNRGLAEIRTELVARMDADDVSHPRRLERQMDYLARYPEVAAVGTHLRFINSRGDVIGGYEFPEEDLPLRWMQLFDCPVSCGAVMFKRSIVWEKLGGFDPSIRYAQDWELWSRLLPAHRLANLPEKLVDVRQHAAAASSAAFAPMLEEQRRIIRNNPQRLLGIEDPAGAGLARIEILLEKRLTEPGVRMDVIDTLFRLFCRRHIGAETHPGVLRILSRQYLEVLYYSRFPRQAQAAARILASVLQSRETAVSFFRTLQNAASQIPGHLRYWIPRSFMGADI
ncbi:glycosyltransferase [Candidatus Parcubacteria bacterium]|nr:MAG: glycosyltransferase [Candidatus Parcubacteria bacterium]